MEPRTAHPHPTRLSRSPGNITHQRQQGVVDHPLIIPLHPSQGSVVDGTSLSLIKLDLSAELQRTPLYLVSPSFVRSIADPLIRPTWPYPSLPLLAHPLFISSFSPTRFGVIFGWPPSPSHLPAIGHFSLLLTRYSTNRTYSDLVAPSPLPLCLSVVFPSLFSILLLTDSHKTQRKMYSLCTYKLVSWPYS